MQRWDAPKQEIENGVYLGHIASISFLGPWALQSVSLALCIVTNLVCAEVYHFQAHTKTVTIRVLIHT